MRKKTAILFSLIVGISLASVATVIFMTRNSFSFSNLSLNLYNIEAVGVGRNVTSTQRNMQLRQIAPTIESPYDELIYQNENGEVGSLDFLNSNGEVVDIPYHLIFVENYGDFIYLAYSNWPKEYLLGITQQDGFRKLFHFAYSNLSSNDFQFQFALVEKNSGKVFDLKEEILNQHSAPDSNASNYLGSSLVYLPDGFAFINSQNNQNCINVARFELGLLNISQTCSTVISGFYESDGNAYALPNGDIRLGNLNNFGRRLINLYSLEITSFDDLPEGHPALYHYYPENSVLNGFHFDLPYSISSTEIRNIIWVDNIAQLAITTFIDNQLDIDFFPTDENFIRPSGQTYEWNRFSPSEYYALSINYGSQILDDTPIKLVQINIDLEVTVIIPDIKTIVPVKHQTKNLSNIRYFVEGDGLYLYSHTNGDENRPFVGRFDLVSLTYETLLEGNGTIILGGRTPNPNPLLSSKDYYEYDGNIILRKYGHYSYSQIEGLVEKNYTYNIYTKINYLEGESLPTTSTYSIYPIN
jgi:hypothetical protein